jgi:hypothetical protein
VGGDDINPEDFFHDYLRESCATASPQYCHGIVILMTLGQGKE